MFAYGLRCHHISLPLQSIYRTNTHKYQNMLSPFGYKHVLVLVFLFSLSTKIQLDISIAMQLLPYLSSFSFFFSCISSFYMKSSFWIEWMLFIHVRAYNVYFESKPVNVLIQHSVAQATKCGANNMAREYHHGWHATSIDVTTFDIFIWAYFNFIDEKPSLNNFQNNFSLHGLDIIFYNKSISVFTID